MSPMTLSADANSRVPGAEHLRDYISANHPGTEMHSWSRPMAFSNKYNTKYALHTTQLPSDTDVLPCPNVFG